MKWLCPQNSQGWFVLVFVNPLRNLYLVFLSIKDNKREALGLTTERRKHKRHQYEAFISHDILSQEATPAGKIYNFSKSGLYFESNDTFYPMEEIFVEIIDHPQSSDPDFELLFDVEIIWLKKLQDASFRYGYGAKFKFPNADFEKKIGLTTLEKPHSVKPESEDETDVREYPRRRCDQSIVFNHRNQVCRGLITDLSRGGAFIKTGIKFSLGQKIKLVITGGKVSKDLKRQAWIVRVSPEGFGISFERRSGPERRFDIDRRIGTDRRKRIKPGGPNKNGP